jgi:phosphatidylserine/phosphatidylglycerophosphate/cardiolipin synthase-like enzyme
MAHEPISPPNSQDPPEPLLIRTARIGPNVVNTLRIPADSFSDDRNAWFNTGTGMPRIREGNEAKYLIDGSNPVIPGLSAFPELSTFPDFIAAIRTTLGPGHFIYMLNWWFDDSFPVPSEPPQLTMREHLTEASDRRVMIRAMFWDQQFSLQNNAEARHINDLDNGAAIIDARGNESYFFETLVPFHFGSQHQKVLCVMGEKGLVSFCGGIDFNQDRISPNGAHGRPLHDVHCRIRGPAAADVLQTFIQRWNDHPEGNLKNRTPPDGKGPLIVLNQAPASAGPHIVQVGRTFGRVNPPYGFAPNGETTAREIIRHAIRNAKRFIYTEDQYFVGNPEVEAALLTALRNGIKHLTILLTHWRISDLPLVQRHRHQFIDRLFDAGGDRVRVFSLQPGPIDANFANGLVQHTYVHAKIWIIDDEFAMIGSVNTNRRCWSHDSEIVAGIYDTSRERILTYRLAHWLRIHLWQEHLNMPGPIGAAELADGVAGAVHWLYPPAGARVHSYNWREAGDYHLPIPLLGLPLELAIYNTIIDPA